MSQQQKSRPKTPKRDAAPPAAPVPAPASDTDSVDTDDEELKIRIGRVPYDWYEEFKHFGYDNKLNKVEKRKQLDKIQQFIAKSENKDWWRTITDDLNQRDIVLTDAQLELIDRIRSGKYASKTIATGDYSIPFEHNDPFPIHAYPPAKRNFMPSKWERMKVNKILDSILQGRIKVGEEIPQEEEEIIFDAWEGRATNELTGAISVAAPKMKLPTHHESYNPPSEYLFNEQELKEWEEMDELDRVVNFVPQKYDKIRHIPFYDKLINERFDRCLDLYLCPRIKKKKLDMNPEALLPKIPQPEQLRPFPTMANILYVGHTGKINTICVCPSGNWLASGDQNGTFIVWEVLSSRKLFTYQFDQPVHAVDWSKKGLILISAGNHVYVYNWKYPSQNFQANQLFIQQSKQQQPTGKSTWQYYDSLSEQFIQGFRIKMNFDSPIKHVEFHHKGDYLLTVSPEEQKKSEVVMVHHISKSASQKPFNKSKGLVVKVNFHPTKAILVVMTRKNVYLFNLQKQMIVKKLKSGAEWYNCLAMHPYGDNLIVGSQDKKLIWYDLDMGETPYKSMQYHDRAITQTQFHKAYPLMATSSNDGTVHILHAKVFNDLLQNALILPLKILKGHSVKEGEGVMDIKFHPTQPWIFSAGADGKLCLWS